MLGKILISVIILVQVLAQNSTCPGTQCSGYCCPSQLQTCSSPAFRDVCWAYCDASTACGNGCCKQGDVCKKEKAGSFCEAKVYPVVGKKIQFSEIDWIYIEWYTTDDSKMTSKFSTMNNTSTSISALSTTMETNYYTGYGNWGPNSTATTPMDMQLAFTCHNYFESCSFAYSIRGGVLGTSSSQE